MKALSITGVLLLFFLAACSLKPHNNKKELKDIHNLKMQEYSFDAKRDTSIIGRKKTQLNVPQYAFEDSNGNNYLGLVQLSLTECYTRRDILESGIETVSNGEPLVSFGFVNIEARDSSGKELFLREDARVRLLLDTNYFVNGYNPEIFYGVTESSGKINWVQDSTFHKESILHMTKIGNMHYFSLQGYEIDAPKLGWINLDSFFDLPAADQTSLSVDVNKDFDSSIKLVLLDVRSVLSGKRSENRKAFFDGLPKGERTALFVYGVEGDKPYFGYKEIITGKNLKTHLEIEYCSFEELNSKFASLDF